MDELSNFKKLLNDIRDGEPENQAADKQVMKIRNKAPFISKKSVGKPVLKAVSPKGISDCVKPNENVLWKENKEFALFSLLTGVVLSIVGIVSSVNYLTLVGAIVFLLSAIIIFLLMFNYAKSFKKSFPPDYSTNVKIDELSQKIELMDAKDYSAGFSLSDERVKEMEGKIEELRTIVKTLMKGAGNTRG